MYFKGTIIITDPCYVIKSRDWESSNYGRNLLGFQGYITEYTLYGDWGCTTYSINNPKEVVEKIAELNKHLDKVYSDDLSEEDRQEIFSDYNYSLKNLLETSRELGDFCADAGMVSVFLLDDVLKYNPEFSQWVLKHPRCVTIIPNFDGNVKYHVDINNEAHIIGTGNINFFTMQTSL